MRRIYLKDLYTYKSMNMNNPERMAWSDFEIRKRLKRAMKYKINKAVKLHNKEIKKGNVKHFMSLGK